MVFSHCNSLTYLESNFILSLETLFSSASYLSKYLTDAFISNSLYYSRQINQWKHFLSNLHSALCKIHEQHFLFPLIIIQIGRVLPGLSNIKIFMTLRKIRLSCFLIFFTNFLFFFLFFSISFLCK